MGTPTDKQKADKGYSDEPSRDSSGDPFLPAFEAKKIAADSPIQILIYILLLMLRSPTKNPDCILLQPRSDIF